jgi:(p)ppGpp synthase/HD superfamily hydrolase
MHVRLARAISDAEYYHRGQRRKHTSIPYLSHLLAVCSLVLEAEGTEDEAIAGVLHDAAEDVRIPGVTGEDVLTAIRLNYGEDVARIVRACSDDLGRAGTDKPPWRPRKLRYLEHLRTAEASTLLVSAADKLHNLRSILADRHAVGEDVWKRFKTGGDQRTDTLWYYSSLLALYESEETAVDKRRERLTREMREILKALV